MTTASPIAGYCDWLAETIRRAADLRRAGDLPADVANMIEGHILAALLTVKRSANKAPRPECGSTAGQSTKTKAIIP
ncbi:MAG: hypothetical protein RBS80_18255 [Thermoguttaceae bacterium]|nr:hypothetical protein [Thermoguttaceae bacterium]